MLVRKALLEILIILFLSFSILIHPLFIAAVLICIHFLINSTDFLYRENTEYTNPDLNSLFHKEAAPIEISRDNSRCVIFVHGFPSTPNTYKYVAPVAADRGYDVFAPLLPGFGTNHEDFIKSNFSQWFSYLCDFYEEKRKRYGKVYVIGLSMGGALTLKLAEKYSDTEMAPDGISANAAPVSLRFTRKGIGRALLLSSIRTLGFFVTHQGKEKSSWREMDDGHGEWLGYEGSFPRQIYSLKMGVYSVRKDLKKITVPVIAYQIPEDRTVDYSNLDYIEKNVSSAVKSFNTLEYTGFRNTAHALFLYESIREKLVNGILDFFEGL